jgi:hypothetical protein
MPRLLPVAEGFIHLSQGRDVSEVRHLKELCGLLAEYVSESRFLHVDISKQLYSRVLKVSFQSEHTS